jgi:thioredoxin-dependent peroxiredoxin
MLSPGDKAPAVALTDQHGNTVKLSDYKGRNVLVFFYPKASTPGCTQQACFLRDLAGQVGDTAIIGISHAWYKISPKDTPVRLLEALAA